MEQINNPLVSIGMPVFNGEKSLAQALDALLEQDYSNLEVIISDNGSTDGTPEICQEFLKKDLRIKYYRSSENLGSNWNFNRVLIYPLASISCGLRMMTCVNYHLCVLVSKS